MQGAPHTDLGGLVWLIYNNGSFVW